MNTMTPAERRYRAAVAAAWRLAGIERRHGDDREYVGKHHRKP